MQIVIKEDYYKHKLMKVNRPLFDLQYSHNNYKAVYLLGSKTCYTKPLVYNEAAQFQFDTLRSEYTHLDSLASRKCEVVMVDEVDRILIDDSSKIDNVQYGLIKDNISLIMESTYFSIRENYGVR